MELKTDGVGGERADDLGDAPAIIRLDPKWHVVSADRISLFGGISSSHAQSFTLAAASPAFRVFAKRKSACTGFPYESVD